MSGKEPSRRKAWSENRAASFRSLPPLPPPTTTRPVVFCVPDHPDWRASLYSVVGELTQWLAWERDSSRSGKAAAAAWRGILQQAIQVAEKGEESECMDWCTIITDCIMNNAGTQQALRELIATDPDIRSTVEQIIQDAAESGKIPFQNRNGVLVTSPLCTPGSIFKQVGTMVSLLHSLTNDLLQNITQGETVAKRAELLVSAFPAIGILPFDEAIGFVVSVVDSLRTEYDAAYTEALYDDLRCGLFCEFKDGCEISLLQALTWYKDKIPSTIPVASPRDLLEAIINFIVTGDIAGDTTVYVFHLLVLATMQAGETILGINFSKFALRIVADQNEIDDDYQQLCEDCPTTWSKTFTFVSSSLGWTVNVGVIQGGGGFSNTGSGSYPYTVDLSKTVVWGTAVLKGISVQASSTAATASGFRGVYFPLTPGAAPLTGYKENTGAYTMVFTGIPEQPTQINVQVSNNPDAGTNFIYAITLTGEGTEPNWS